MESESKRTLEKRERAIKNGRSRHKQHLAKDAKPRQTKQKTQHIEKRSATRITKKTRDCPSGSLRINMLFISYIRLQEGLKTTNTSKSNIIYYEIYISIISEK
jgi:hypothetical protein